MSAAEQAVGHNASLRTIAARTLRWLGIAASALSLVKLVEHSLTEGLSSTMQVVLTYYNALLGVALDWLKPPLEGLLTALGRYFGLPAELPDSWKHTLVLLALVVGSISRAYNSAFGIGSAAFAAAFGLFWVLASFIGYELLDTSEIRRAIMWPVLHLIYDQSGVSIQVNSPFYISIVYFMLLDFVLGVWHAVWFTRGAQSSLLSVAALEALLLPARLVLLTALAIAVLGTRQFLGPGFVPEAGIEEGTVPVILGYAGYWIILTAVLERDWRSNALAYMAYRSRGGWTIGLSMLAVFVAAACFLLANAGLSLAGL